MSLLGVGQLVALAPREPVDIPESDRVGPYPERPHRWHLVTGNGAQRRPLLGRTPIKW